MHMAYLWLGQPFKALLKEKMIKIQDPLCCQELFFQEVRNMEQCGQEIIKPQWISLNYQSLCVLVWLYQATLSVELILEDLLDSYFLNNYLYGIWVGYSNHFLGLMPMIQ